MAEQMDKKLDVWKKKLLDLGKRNRLLNYKDNPKQTLNIVKPDFEELYKSVADGRTMTLPYYSNGVPFDTEPEDLPPGTRTLGNLSTDQTLKDTIKTAKYLRTKARTVSEEQGVNVLYLAFGFMDWREAGTRDVYVAPIVLVPVKLAADRVVGPYKFTMDDDEILFNPTLRYKLEEDFKLDVPYFDEDADNIEEYLDAIETLVEPLGWKVKRTAALAILSFAKINMYKDLERRRGVLVNHPLVRALAGVPSDSDAATAAEFDLVSGADHDANFQPERTFQILDADSSQQDAIFLSKRGQSFILQGPPGTGKSQTIANIIAEALADGKRVLFVSEKTAALDVVYKRLEAVGLSDFCLVLHSSKINKRDVVRALGSTLFMNADVGNTEVAPLLELKTVRDDLNRYCRELHESVAPLGQSVFDANGVLANLKDAPDVAFQLWKDAAEISPQELEDMRLAVRDFAAAKSSLREDWRTHTWARTTLQTVGPVVRNDVSVLLDSLVLRGDEFAAKAAEVRSALGLDWTIPVANMAKVVDAMRFAPSVKAFPQEWLAASDPELASYAANIEPFRKTQKNAKELRDALTDSFLPDLFLLDVDKYISDVREAFAEYRRELAPSLKSLADNELVTAAPDVRKKLTKGSARLDEWTGVLRAAAAQSSLNPPDAFAELPDFAAFLRALSTEMRPREFWFELKWRDAEAREAVCAEAESLFAALVSSRAALCAAWGAEETTPADASDAEKERLFNLWLNKRFMTIINELRIGTTTMRDMLDLVRTIVRRLGIDEPTRYSELAGVVDAARLYRSVRKPGEFWFSEKWRDKAARDAVYDEAEAAVAEIRAARDELLADYEKEILDFEPAEMWRRFKAEYFTVFRVLKKSYRQDFKTLRGYMKDMRAGFNFDKAVRMISLVRRYRDALDVWTANEKRFADYLGGWFEKEDTDFAAARAAADAFAPILDLCPGGFPSDVRERLIAGTAANDLDSEISRLEALIAPNGALDRVVKLTSFQNDDDYLVVLKQGANNTLELLEKYQCVHASRGGAAASPIPLPSEQLDTADAVSFIVNAGGYFSALAAIADRENVFRDYLGGWYEGETTNFYAVRSAFVSFDLVLNRYSGGIPEDVRDALISGAYVGKFDDCALKVDAMTASDPDLAPLLAALEPAHANDSFERLRATADAAVAGVDKFVDILRNVSALHAPDGKRMPPLDALGKLKRMKKLDEDAANNAAVAVSQFRWLFSGPDTDWDDVAVRLDRVRKLRKLADAAALPESYLTLLASNPEACGESGVHAEWLDSFRAAYEPLAKRFADLFEPGFAASCNTVAATTAAARRCKQNLVGLDDWIEFKRTKTLCLDFGLRGLVDAALNGLVEDEKLTDAFLKRFEWLWMERVLPGRNSVNFFNIVKQTRRVDNFRDLDVRQLEIAANRLRSGLLANRPPVSYGSPRKSEMGILLHELEKKTRIMPVRKLVDSLPTVLPRLKPCIMTSPISVSLFLQSDAYEFDLAVFDEASQVRTENAIGAISRCKQVVIAGDSKQLPPTSFFSVSSSGSDEYDEDEEADDSDCYESILDEVSSLLPKMTLKWHYRSRNESLITFSNRKIYDNSLTTFPAPFDKTTDGVSMEYVPDGWYQRSTKRNNPTEAKRVADVVFAQLEKFPNRSIGVVTFSESQRKCVEDEIECRRAKDDSYEEFFREDREEPFFVKNLENVQGDERDTIIFSVGYGKTGPGEDLYMNFGPLNRKGGERRLNVAVTRAKYAVIVVSSIKAQDMRVTESSPRGVHLLQDYLAFAEQGVAALDGEQTGVDELEMKSSFENSVCEFLRANGYDFATRVGCSEYRVDIAIRHPSVPGKYILGIECDGAAYRAARTARDRDRLRQSVLENMGWRFYRVWSAVWVKSPETEGKRLLDAVQTALEAAIAEERKAAANRPKPRKPRPAASGSTDSFDRDGASVGAAVGSVNAGSASAAGGASDDAYSRADASVGAAFGSVNAGSAYPNPLRFSTYDPLTFSVATSVNEHVVYSALKDVVGQLAPIHARCLYQTLAPLYGEKSATNSVVEAVRRIVNSPDLAGVLERRGDFFWRKGQQTVQPRVPAPGDTPREARFIPVEEFAEAFDAAIAATPGCDRNILYNLIAQIFGLGPVTIGMRNQFIQAIKLLTTQGRARELDGRLYKK